MCPGCFIRKQVSRRRCRGTGRAARALRGVQQGGFRAAAPGVRKDWATAIHHSHQAGFVPPQRRWCRPLVPLRCRAAAWESQRARSWQQGTCLVEARPVSCMFSPKQERRAARIRLFSIFGTTRQGRMWPRGCDPREHPPGCAQSWCAPGRRRARRPAGRARLGTEHRRPRLVPLPLPQASPTCARRHLPLGRPQSRLSWPRYGCWRARWVPRLS